jgi:hypothetical protein
VFENRVLRRIFGPKRAEVTGGCRKLHNEELHNLYSSPDRYCDSQIVGGYEEGGVCSTHGREKYMQKTAVGNPEGMITFRKSGLRCGGSIKRILQKLWEGNQLGLSVSGSVSVTGCCQHGNEPSWVSLEDGKL